MRSAGYYLPMLIQSLPYVPDLLALHESDQAFFPFLLQGVGERGWDILMAAPQSLQVYTQPSDAFAFWRDLGSLSVNPLENSPFPFIGGWFVYLGYELLHSLEPSVASWPEAHFPLAALARVPAAVLFNRSTGESWVVAEDHAENVWREVLERLDVVQEAVTGMPKRNSPLHITEEAPEIFLDGVTKIRDYIHEGDVFQVNLSRAWRAEMARDASAGGLYRQLRLANPGPFNALVNLGDAQILSSSPERLLSIRQGLVSTRPIAGTHPRSPDPIEDFALKARLIQSTKERAEHIMLIDLERNDLGRICVPGSVQVEELMSVESYAFVHHIESVVSGRLQSHRHPSAAIAALFPGGTITGCPKVRTMQIIRELESGPRGAYTGSLGYINHDGSMDLNILIRSFMRKETMLEFRAGAGIVADSDPERELAETRAKAKGLLRALQQ